MTDLTYPPPLMNPIAVDAVFYFPNSIIIVETRRTCGLKIGKTITISKGAPDSQSRG
jgi:hypothetical protein